MKISDATLLAYTKFKTRKARSILTILGSSFLVAILLFLTIAGTGLRNSVGDATGRISSLNATFQYVGYDGSDTTKSTEEQISDYEKFVKKSGVTPKGVYGYFDNGLPFTLEGFSESSTQGGFTVPKIISFVSQDLFDKNLFQDQNSNWSPGEPIPVVLDYDILKSEHSTELNSINDAVERTRKLEEFAKEVVGVERKINLNIQQPNKDGIVEYNAEDKGKDYIVKIVGFKPSSSSFFASISGSFSLSGMHIPYEVASEIPEIKETINAVTAFVAAFDSKADRDVFIEASSTNQFMKATAFGDLSEGVKSFTGTISSIFKTVIIVMLLFVTLPTMGTLSKVLADSRRETGVFRAIGAKNRDILQIYVSYSILLATIAFIVALAIATGISMWLTLSKGAELGASLAEFGGTVQAKTVVLFGVDIIHWLFLYVVLVLSAVLGAIIPVSRELRRDPITAMRDE